MMSVKAGLDFDDEGDSINNVEKVLKSFDVQLRDSSNSFRDLDDVLAEAAKKYNELGAAGDTVAQGQITTALAGLRQANYLAALFQNWDQVTKAQEIAANSMGSTSEKYQIYLQSIEAAANKSKTSWEKVWQTTINNDVIKFFYEFSSKIADAIDKVGGLIPLIVTLSGALIAINFNSVTAGIAGVISSLKTMFTVIATGSAASMAQMAAATAGISLLLAGLAYLVTSYKANQVQVEATTRSIEEITSAIQELSSKMESAESSITTVQELTAEFEKLSGVTERTNDQQERWLSIQNELKDIIPALVGSYDEEGNFLISNTSLLETYVGLKREELAILKEKRAIELNQKISDLTFDVEQAGVLRDAADQTVTAWNYLLNSVKDLPDTQKVSVFNIETNEKETMSAGEATAYYTDQLKLHENQLSTNSLAYRDLANQLDLAKTELDILTDADKDNDKVIEKSVKSFEQLAAAAELSSDAFESNLSSLSAMEKDYQANGEISLAQANQLITMGYAEALMIDTKTGKLGMNMQVVRALIIENARLAESDAQKAYASAAAIDPINKETQALYKKWQVTKAIADKLSAMPEANFSFGSFGGGGGSGKSAQEKLNTLKKEAYQQEIKAANAQKKAAQDEIKALQDKKDAFNDIIDAQKESLRLTKEENDYQKELQEKNKELADIDAELIQLQFDNSEEGNARRLELEEQRAEKTADIAEYQADRTYDIQIEALDREADAYAKMIDMQIAGVQTMIDGYDAVISKINEMIDALSKLASASSGSGSYSAPTTTSNLTAQGNKKYTGTSPSVVNAEIALGRDLNNNGILGLSSGGSFETNSEGLIRVHPNEIGAVLNKSQISAAAPFASFMSSIIKNSGTPHVYSNNVGGGGVSIGDIQISVAGNLDKTVLPDLKEMIMKTITDATRNTGTLRNAKSFSV